uniref:Uncharacterized protein n=1 Tax=Denticeps clupeoides TaxID=299321 RepID=A0AAY4DIC0_9TELE
MHRAERDGVPPSTAVTVARIMDCFSRSRGVCSTSSADTLPPMLCTSREKCSLAQIVNKN